MSWGVIVRARRWCSRRGGVHRRGAIRTGVDAALEHELEQARERLAEVDALAPAVDQRVERAQVWMRRNHLGPLFDEALGFNPSMKRKKA